MATTTSGSKSAFDTRQRQRVKAALAAHSRRVHVVRAPPALALIPKARRQATRDGHGAQIGDSTGATERSGADPAVLEVPAPAEDDGEKTGGSMPTPLFAEQSAMEAMQQQQRRLGERFLRMMTVLTRLARTSIEDEVEGSGPDVAVSPASTKRAPVLQLLPPPGGAAINLKLVHATVASEPLHLILTGQIAQMLPQPMDGRQQALQSPIKRKLLRPRRRKRRRRRRRGLRRTWHASHATWLPRASAEYIRVHAKNDFIGSSSKLMTRFAQLKQLQGTASSGNLNERKYLYAFSPTRKDSHHDESDGDDMEHGNDDGEDDDDDDEDEDEEDDFHIENLILMDDNRSPASASLDSGAPHSPRNDRRDSHIPTVTLPVVSHRPHSHELTGLSTRYDASTLAQDAETEAARAEPQSSHNDSTRSVQVRAFKPMLCHQAAWLSPELTAWLVASGMFLTRPKREV